MLCCWHGFCVAGAAEAPFSVFALAPLPTLYSNIASPTTAPQAFLYLLKILKKFSTALRHARGTFPFLLFFPTSCPFPLPILALPIPPFRPFHPSFSLSIFLLSVLFSLSPLLIWPPCSSRPFVGSVCLLLGWLCASSSVASFAQWRT